MKKVNYPGLIKEMAARGDTQETLGKILNLSKSSISRRLSGEIEWSIGEIETICNHYEKDAYELNLIKG
jgi:transcriptional regulator with XRE-family HTH domain